MTLILDTITSGYSLSKVNANFQKIEDSINDDTLRREVEEGDSNEMRTTLDMNSNKITNLLAGANNQDAVTVGQVNLLAKNITVGDLTAIARTLNVLDVQVINSTNTEDILDGVLYIYDVASQKTWGKPSGVGSGETIISISDNILHTSVSTYTLILIPIGIYTTKIVDATLYGAVGDRYESDGFTLNPSYTDNTPFIQAALDSAPHVHVILPRRLGSDITGYGIKSPIYLDYGNQIAGAGVVSTKLVKTTNTLGVGSYTHPDTTVQSYVVDAAIIKRAPNGSSSLNQGVQDLILESEVYGFYGIYAVNMSQGDDRDITIQGFRNAYFAYDQFLCSMQRVWARNDGFTRCELGFDFTKGTSLSMRGCWAKKVIKGFEFGQLQYAVVDVATDDFTFSACNGGNQITYTGFGAEEGVITEGGFVLGNGARELFITGAASGTITADISATNVSFFNFNGTNATIKAFRLTTLGGDASTRMDMFKLAGDASVSYKGILPPSSQYRSLVTHVTSFSSLKEDKGAFGYLYHTKDQPTVSIGPDQYNNSVLKYGKGATIGDPTFDPTLPLTSDPLQLINTKTITSTSTDILQLTNTVNNYNLVIDILCTALGTTTSTVIRGLIAHINGTPGTLTQIIEIGSTHTLVATWVGGKLQLKVANGADRGTVEVRVRTRVSTGTPLLEWL